MWFRVPLLFILIIWGNLLMNQYSVTTQDLSAIWNYLPQVRPCNNSESIEEYHLVLYRFYEESNYHLSNIQLLSIVEDSVPALAIALTSHHSTRWVIFYFN